MQTAARMASSLARRAPRRRALPPRAQHPAGTCRSAACCAAGRQAAAIGGYNAGSAVVGRWLEGGVGLAEDVGVEAIPYDETRAYVRRVLRSLHAYRVIY
jgi:hypothetical protein